MADLRISAMLRQHVQGRKNIEIDSGPLDETLAEIGLLNYLWDDGRDCLHGHVAIYINDDDVRYLQDGIKTKVGDGDEVSVMTAVAGG